jgi:hypothetical protein
MGSFSVILNLITIFLVLALFYVGYNIYRTRDDKNMTPTEVFDQMLVDPDTVSHAYITNSKLGPVGDFGLYDWNPQDGSSLSEE